MEVMTMQLTVGQKIDELVARRGNAIERRAAIMEELNDLDLQVRTIETGLADLASGFTPHKTITTAKRPRKPGSGAQLSPTWDLVFAEFDRVCVAGTEYRYKDLGEIAARVGLPKSMFGNIGHNPGTKDRFAVMFRKASRGVYVKN